MSTITRIAEQHGVNPNTVQDTYRVFNSVQQRCNNPKSTVYYKYGGKGVTVCDRWDTFEHFVSDMGLRPSVAHSIDRTDNRKGYEPDNCRWATEIQQQRNRSNNRVVEYQGEELCVAELAERIGLSAKLLRARLERGWSVDRAVSTPVQTQNRKSAKRQGVKVHYYGRWSTVRELAELGGMTVRTMRWRLKAGWTVKRAVLSPPGFPAPHKRLRVEPVI